jgi:hypothetical protein
MIKIKKKKKIDSVDDKNFKYLSFYLKAKSATISPPLSSVLGNIGVNTGNFAKEFNNLTDNLQTYMWLKVYVRINMSLQIKTWIISLGSITTSYIFRIISLKQKIKLKGSGGFYFKEYAYITLHNFFLVIIFMHGYINIAYIKNKLAIIQSMDMLIFYKDKIIFNPNSF